MYIKKLLLLFVVYGLSVAQGAKVKSKNTMPKRKYYFRMFPWDLSEALVANTMIEKFNGTWISDYDILYLNRTGSLYTYNAGLNISRQFTYESLLELYQSQKQISYQLSPDRTKILIMYDFREMPGQPTLGKCDIFDRETRKSFEIHNGLHLQYCLWSPILNRLAYVYRNDVYIRFSKYYVYELSKDGSVRSLFNGAPDSTYKQYIFTSGSAMWWSDDGDYLAVAAFNDSKVAKFKYHLYDEQIAIRPEDDPQREYPHITESRYSKAGSNIPVAAVKIYDLSGDIYNKYVTIKAPVESVGNESILHSVTWTHERKLLTIWMNRQQNIMSFQWCNITGHCVEIRRIEEPYGYVSITEPKCFKYSTVCVFIYWNRGWKQIWKMNLENGINIYKRHDDYSVKEILAFNENTGDVYHRSALKSDPSTVHVYVEEKCLTCDLTDVSGARCLSATASFSKKFTYYLAECHGPAPTFSKVFETEDKREIRIWENNRRYRRMASRNQKPRYKIEQVKLSDGSKANVKILYPSNFDKSKKYPLIVEVHGEPNSVSVSHNYSVGFDTYMATKHQVIYVLIDGRGTGDRGKDYLFSINNHLGEFEVEDQMHVAKYLQTQYPFVDKDRCGVWGWSYGGYLTTRILENDDDNIFKCGIAVSPIASWWYYNSFFSEKYMGAPSKNMDKYKKSSILQKVDNFRTHDFLLMHGTGDDNVHFQHSMLLAKILQHHDIMFEQMVYSDDPHRNGQFPYHYYHTMANFWINCFNLEEDPNLDLYQSLFNSTEI